MAENRQGGLQQKAEQIRQQVKAGTNPVQAVNETLGTETNGIAAQEAMGNRTGVAEDIDNQNLIEMNQ